MEGKHVAAGQREKAKTLLAFMCRRRRITARLWLISSLVIVNVIISVAITVVPASLNKRAGGFHDAVHAGEYWKVRYHLLVNPKLAMGGGDWDNSPLAEVSDRFYDRRGENTDEIRAKIAGLLLDYGAVASAGPESELRLARALWMATYLNRPAVVKVLLEREGKRISQRDLDDALERAADGDYIEIITLLLDNGADVNLGGRTSVLISAMTGGKISYPGPMDEVVRLLLKRGANVNARWPTWSSRETPLHIAIGSSDISSVAIEEMIAHGTDVNAIDDEGRTPLHIAASEVLRLSSGLASLESDPDLVRRLQRESERERDLMKLLIAHGAREDIKDRKGKTPADILAGR